MILLYPRWKFTLLLLALLALLVAYPLIREGTTLAAIGNVFAVVVFLAAILALFQRRESRLLALVLGIPTLAATFTHYYVPALSPRGGVVFYHSVPVVFFGYTVASILRSIYLEKEVSLDTINGAFCGYLLIAVAFGHLYCLTEALRPGSFVLHDRIGTMPQDQDARHLLLTYFSLVTLTTVGFGDILPANDVTRMLAGVEAMVGQFYVAVIVAELIALKVSAALRVREPH